MLLTKLYISICLLLVSGHIKGTYASVEPLEHLPEDLQSYLDTCLSSGNLTEQSARLVFWASINQYTSRFIASKPELSPKEAHYFKTNLEDAFAELFPHVRKHGGNRFKRQTFELPGATGVRVRKEIRAMTVNERISYFAAVNALKIDRSLPPNVYDFLADYHSGGNILRAHFGPAFPSWHRLYLWIFEFFLRLQDPTVTVPYWASVLDSEMWDPTQSVIWSPGFYGNGDGAIRTGPFRNWPFINPQTSFRRNVLGGELFTYNGVNRILSRSRNAEILIPTAFPDSNLELQHGSAHTFVGGSMNDLNSAARDPVFFSHHCFVDEIWERFRSRQTVNPETDYPFAEFDPRFRPQHEPTATAGFAGLSGFRDWTQNIGYLNVFSNVVIYEPVPECPFCADSPYLFCSTSGRCVSRSIAEMGGRSDVVFDIDSIPGQRFRRHSPTTSPHDASLEVCQKRSFLNDVETRWFGRSEPLQGPPTHTWAYIPVKVVTKRAPEYNEFDEYSLYSQRTGAQLGFKNELLTQGLQKRSESCEKFQGAVGKITIMSHGLNYEGYAEEYVLTDNRLGVAEASGFIPVKMPTGSQPSEAIIAAFDSCGRVCKPYSKTRAPHGAMLTGNNFSGGIRVSNNHPKQFSDSYTDALLNIWDVPTKSSCPTLNHDNMPVSFFCEFTDTSIWESVITRHRQGPDMSVQKQEYPILTETETLYRERQGGVSIGNPW